jgi:hypothetical protein
MVGKRTITICSLLYKVGVSGSILRFDQHCEPESLLWILFTKSYPVYELLWLRSYDTLPITLTMIYVDDLFFFLLRVYVRTMIGEGTYWTMKSFYKSYACSNDVIRCAMSTITVVFSIKKSRILSVLLLDRAGTHERRRRLFCSLLWLGHIVVLYFIVIGVFWEDIRDQFFVLQFVRVIQRVCCGWSFKRETALMRTRMVPDHWKRNN